MTVSGIDRDASHRLPVAADLGFETVNVAATPIEDATDRLTDRGFDVVIDATGAGAGLEAAGSAVRKGGRVVLVGQTGTATVEFTRSSAARSTSSVLRRDVGGVRAGVTPAARRRGLSSR